MLIFVPTNNCDETRPCKFYDGPTIILKLVGSKMHRVVAGILEKDGKFMTRGAPHKAMAGKWEFPGGSRTKQLSRCAPTGVQRGVRFGSRCRTWVGKVKHDYEDVVVELTAYLITTTSEVISSKDHDRISWSSLADHSYT